MTIIEAIKQVMLAHGSPMTYKEAYNAIAGQNLYQFHSANPASIVLAQIRRACVGIDFPSSSPTKHFRFVEDGRYWPLDEPHRGTRRLRTGKTSRGGGRESPLVRIERSIKALSQQYTLQLKRKLLEELRRLSPAGFESFAKRLLDVYGFHGMQVTQISRDGGIDGHGQLSVGLASLRVAFQCKRWTKGNIQRPEVDRFRGAIQGRFDQGVFFATTSFSDGAIADSIRLGAAPIVLVDGEAIVNMMIEKGFGVQKITIEIPTYALDLVLSGDEGSGGA